MKWIELWAMLEVIGCIIGVIIFILYTLIIILINWRNKNG